MSTTKQSGETPRPPVGRGPGGHGPMGMAGMPVEKAKNFKGTLSRLTGLLKPEAVVVFSVLIIGAASVGLSVTGPKVLGEATTTIFKGFLSGQGIDFGRLHRILIGVVAIYVASSLLGYLQGYILNGMTQRTIYRLRETVEDKIHRLPLNYFDKHQRGELLSRVTNDIDNVSQTLQQTLSQLFNSLLTVIGVLIMMLWIDWQLALVAVVSIPITIGIVTAVAKRSQPKFVAQWKHTGALNGIIEEGYSGHALVKVFGRQREVEAIFAEKNEEMYEASFGAQFISGIIMPSAMFVGNLVYVGIAVVGGLKVASGTSLSATSRRSFSTRASSSSRSASSARWRTCFNRASRAPSACLNCSTRRTSRVTWTIRNRQTTSMAAWSSRTCRSHTTRRRRSSAVCP